MYAPDIFINKADVAGIFKWRWWVLNMHLIPFFVRGETSLPNIIAFHILGN